MKPILLLIFIISSNIFSIFAQHNVYLPVNSSDRKDTASIELTAIGKFGLMRKARPGIPAHYHTGMDIKRSSNNYEDEPIYPITKGIIISRRDDRAYAQLIIEHPFANPKIWSVYEHVAGISVNVGDTVDVYTKIARYMTRAELNKLGWQFDHLHLEILKVKPEEISPSTYTPNRHFKSYSLICYTKTILYKYFYNPMEFFIENL